MMSILFKITFDTRSKEILLDALNKEIILAEDAIRSGDYSQEAFIRMEELFRLKRGILYSKPEEEHEIQSKKQVGPKVSTPKRPEAKVDS